MFGRGIEPRVSLRLEFPPRQIKVQKAGFSPVNGNVFHVGLPYGYLLHDAGDDIMKSYSWLRLNEIQ